MQPSQHNTQQRFVRVTSFVAQHGNEDETDDYMQTNKESEKSSDCENSKKKCKHNNHKHHKRKNINQMDPAL